MTFFGLCTIRGGCGRQATRPETEKLRILEERIFGTSNTSGRSDIGSGTALPCHVQPAMYSGPIKAFSEAGLGFDLYRSRTKISPVLQLDYVPVPFSLSLSTLFTHTSLPNAFCVA